MALQPYYQNYIDGNGIERCQFVFEGLRCAPNGELVWQTNKDGAIGSVVFTGQQKFGDGTAALPSVTFSGNSTSGLFNVSGKIGLSYLTTEEAAVTSEGLAIRSSATLGFSSGTPTVSALDVILARDAANSLGLRNGTNAQTFSLYGTYTNGSNFEQLSMFADSGGGHVRTAKLGTGVARALNLGVGADHWQINTSGYLLATIDNTYDIGASGATRPKDYYGAGNITIGGTLSAATAIATIGPSTPAGTTSLTFVMMGLAGSITTKTGKIVLTMSGVMADSLANDGSKCQMSYGTGTAPVNGAAVTGTQVGPIQQFNAANVNAETCPYGATWIITGLTPNTTYWFDTALAAITGGTATITQATMVAHDLP